MFIFDKSGLNNKKLVDIVKSQSLYSAHRISLRNLKQQKNGRMKMKTQIEKILQKIEKLKFVMDVIETHDGAIVYPFEKEGKVSIEKLAVELSKAGAVVKMTSDSLTVFDVI